MNELGGNDRVVIVSPHVDDAVLSVGATVASLAGRGAAVRVVTIFAGDPADAAPASYWDAQRGAESAGDAARLRREEDAAACAGVGAEPMWLPFADSGYVAPRDPDAICEALEPHLRWADLVALPGWPLSHADHRFSTLLVLERHDATTPLSFYAELPYAYEPVRVLKGRLRGRMVSPLRYALGADLHWERSATSADDAARKAEAVQHYGGELDSLGVRGRWALGWSRRFGEWIGQLPPAATR